MAVKLGQSPITRSRTARVHCSKNSISPVEVHNGLLVFRWHKVGPTEIEFAQPAPHGAAFRAVDLGSTRGAYDPGLANGWIGSSHTAKGFAA